MKADRIDAIAARLGLDADGVMILRAELAGLLPDRDRRDRLDERDDAIREAVAAFYSGLRPTVAAKELARDLDRYLATAWRCDTSSSAKRAALRRIARGNEGRSIGWRQIVNIADNARGG